jgi:hypothetical protein
VLRGSARPAAHRVLRTRGCRVAGAALGAAYSGFC